MGSLDVNVNISGTFGGETLRYSDKRTITTGDEKADFIALVADNDTSVTLWTAAASPLGSFQAVIIIVDPNDDYADAAAAAKLDIEFNGASDSIAFTVRREAPLILTTDDIGSDQDNVDEVIDQIKAKNTNAEGVGDVEVRVILLGNA